MSNKFKLSPFLSRLLSNLRKNSSLFSPNYDFDACFDMERIESDKDFWVKFYEIKSDIALLCDGIRFEKIDSISLPSILFNDSLGACLSVLIKCDKNILFVRGRFYKDEDSLKDYLYSYVERFSKESNGAIKAVFIVPSLLHVTRDEEMLRVASSVVK